MATNSKAKKMPQNTICLRTRRLERSRLSLSRHAVVPTVIENSKCDRKEKLTSLVGKIRYAQNRAQKLSNRSQSDMNYDDKPIWEVD